MATILNNIPQSFNKKKKTPEHVVSTAKEALLTYIQTSVSAATQPSLEGSQSAGSSNASVDSLTKQVQGLEVKADDTNSEKFMTRLMSDKANAEKTLRKRLHFIKIVLYGDTNEQINGSTASSIGSDIDESMAPDLSKCLQQSGLILLLIENINIIPFEARKDVALIFNNLIRMDVCGFVEYTNSHRDFIVTRIISGYGSSEAALSSGSMARELIRYESLHRYVLYPRPDQPSENALIWDFFDKYVHLPNFEVASDSFNTLRELLVSTRNKNMVLEFLERFYDTVFEKYQLLINSDNYVTRKRSLKMLGEVLLDRNNFNIMIRFISSKNNLKTIMMILRDKSPSIQFEAFHVFKVFVANPNKPPEITSVLAKNKVKLIAYLQSFQTDKDDSQFINEKALLIETLSSLEDPGTPPSDKPL